MIQALVLEEPLDDGVFGSRQKGWRPDLPDACAEPFIPVLWLQVLELLGRVPKGSTARFLDGRHLAALIRPPATSPPRPRARRRSLRRVGPEAAPHACIGK